MAGMIWTALDPVPMTATLLSLKSQWLSHLALWKLWPWNDSIPLNPGVLGSRRNPQADMTWEQTKTSSWPLAPLIWTSHLLSCSIHLALFTDVESLKNFAVSSEQSLCLDNYLSTWCGHSGQNVHSSLLSMQVFLCPEHTMMTTWDWCRRKTRKENGLNWCHNFCQLVLQWFFHFPLFLIEKNVMKISGQKTTNFDLVMFSV